MALWFVAFQGSTPIGGPVVGLVMGWFGARAGLGLGAVTCFLAAIGGAIALKTIREHRAAAASDAEAEAEAKREALKTIEPPPVVTV
jgi:hypothetical protein